MLPEAITRDLWTIWLSLEKGLFKATHFVVAPVCTYCLTYLQKPNPAAVLFTYIFPNPHSILTCWVLLFSCFISEKTEMSLNEGLSLQSKFFKWYTWPPSLFTLITTLLPPHHHFDRNKSSYFRSHSLVTVILHQNSLSPFFPYVK